jgi:signal recognition particle subunit SRP72
LYSQGKFEESVRVNEKLLASTQDREASEIKVNLLAAQAGLLFSHPETDKKVEVGNGSDLYEVAYNAASVYLARGQVKKAQEQLEMAKSK